MSERHLGIDLGGTKIEGVVLDGDEIRVRKRIPTEPEGGYEHVVERIAALVAELRREVPDAAVLGIGTPGSLSARTGLLKNSNTQCLNGKPLLRDLERSLGLRVLMENDANCFALAEAIAGAGRGHEVVFGVILGTGVGGGVIIGGRCWTGPQHIAGEWGHHAIDPAGPPCYCGQRGCVESLLSGPALERAYREATGSDARAREIAALAERGDAAAAAVLAGYLARFGRALANVIDILDPSIVVLGGGLSNLDALYGRGRDEIAARVFNDELRTPIVRHRLGDSAGVIGAALLARSSA